MKLLIAVLTLVMISCSKADKIKCFKCYENDTRERKWVYDTCVIEGQRTWMDDNINCYEN